ncbi:MAG: hypothetical protein ACK55I_16820, partial [bacterium]
GRDAVEREFGCRPGLEPRGPRDDFGPRVHEQEMIAALGCFARRARQERREGTALFGQGHGATRIRRRAASRDANHRVLGTDRQPIELGGDAARVIFHALARRA